MKSTRLLSLLVLCFVLVSLGCSAQHDQVDRQPAVAGQFYPAQKDTLRSLLQSLFAGAAPSKHIAGVVAIICPHAGYVYSGRVAASSYNQLDPAKEYDNIFVLGPSHHVGFEGASVYTQGDYITPLGTVKVNRELAAALVKSSSVFTSRTDAHAYEHSVEVQLPFLQYFLKKSFHIVPIVIGSGSPQIFAKIAAVLKPYLTTRNLFVISTDFSHYPAYHDAEIVDKATAEAVLSNSADNLARTIGRNEEKNIPNLATSMCGLSCVMTLLYMTQQNPQFVFEPVEYKNSGDVPIGDRSRVVGYYAITVSQKSGDKDSGFWLDAKDKQGLLKLARATLDTYLHTQKIPDAGVSGMSTNVQANCGAFVTLRKHGALRGCVGRFDATEPLYSVVQQMAVAAAVQDYRFPPVDADELNTLNIEISVLTPLRKIRSIDEIQMGKHGIYMRKGSSGGTFLPQVATETGWTKEEFLGHCAQDKAGIGWDGWKNADLYVYEAIVFTEKEGL